MKKLSIKQKQHINNVLKKVAIGLSIALNIIFVIILIGSFVISSKQKAQDSVHTEVIKSKENRAYSYTKSYSDNIITTPNDISDNDIYGGVYGSEVILSPYVLYCPMDLYFDNRTGTDRYVAKNGVGSYTVMYTLFYDMYGVSHLDYDLTFDIRTKDNTLPVINGYRVNYFFFSPINATRCELSVNLTNVNTNVTQSYFCLRYDIGSENFGYRFNLNNVPTLIMQEAFSGKYYLPKLNAVGNTYESRGYYKQIVYLFSQYSIHNLTLGYKDVFTTEYLNSYFSQFDMIQVYGAYLMRHLSNDVNYNGNLFILNGDFYVEGKYFNQIALYYSKYSIGDLQQVEYRINVGVPSDRIGAYDIDGNTKYGDFYYLSSIVVSNSLNNDYINLVYPVTVEYLGVGVSRFNIHTGSYLLENYVPQVRVKAIVPNSVYNSDITGYTNVVSNVYNYSKSLNFFTYYNNFNFNYNDGNPYITINDTGDTNGIENYTGTLIDVFNIINVGFGGLTTLFNWAILPGISLGVLFAIPLTLTLVLFIIKLFKR